MSVVKKSARKSKRFLTVMSVDEYDKAVGITEKLGYATPCRPNLAMAVREVFLALDNKDVFKAFVKALEAAEKAKAEKAAAG